MHLDNTIFCARNILSWPISIDKFGRSRNTPSAASIISSMFSSPTLLSIFAKSSMAVPFSQPFRQQTRTDFIRARADRQKNAFVYSRMKSLTRLKYAALLTPGIIIASTLSSIPARTCSSSCSASAVTLMGIPGMCTAFTDPKNSPRFIAQYTSSDSSREQNVSNTVRTTISPPLLFFSFVKLTDFFYGQFDFPVIQVDPIVFLQL